MIHMIFELFVSSARICAHTSASPGACACKGPAAPNKPNEKETPAGATENLANLADTFITFLLDVAICSSLRDKDTTRNPLRAFRQKFFLVHRPPAHIRACVSARNVRTKPSQPHIFQ